MSERDRTPLPAGRPPWDPWNGARVGAVVGGLVGVGVAVVLSLTSFWLVPLGAAAGAAVGYQVEKAKQRSNRPKRSRNDG